MAQENQTARILAHLKAGKAITPIEALNRYSCFRLGARIYDLKQDGHQIQSELVDVGDGTKVAQYSLVTNPAQQEPAQ